MIIGHKQKKSTYFAPKYQKWPPLKMWIIFGRPSIIGKLTMKSPNIYSGLCPLMMFYFKTWVECPKFGHPVLSSEFLNNLQLQFRLAMIKIKSPFGSGNNFKTNNFQNLSKIIFSRANLDLNLTGKCTNFGHGVQTQGTLPYIRI